MCEIPIIENVAMDNNLYSERCHVWTLIKCRMEPGLKDSQRDCHDERRRTGHHLLYKRPGLWVSRRHLMKMYPAIQSLKYEIELLEVIKDIDAYEQAKIDSIYGYHSGVRYHS